MSYPKDVFSRMYSGLSKADDGLLYPKEEEKEQDVDLQEVDETLQTNIFNTMLSRRSQRKFEDKQVEDSKVEMIFAAADTAPTAGGFQGFEIYHVKDPEVKLKLVDASNKQPYVNSPVVLVFCMNPERIKMNFPPNIIKKFSLQDATLASSIFTACSTCTRFKLYMDRNDRRRKSNGSTRDIVFTFFHSVFRISTEDAST